MWLLVKAPTAYGEKQSREDPLLPSNLQHWEEVTAQFQVLKSSLLQEP